MTHTIPKKKIETVKELTDLVKSKKTLLLADVSSIPGSQYQAIVKKLRGKAIVKVPKRNLIIRALENSGKKEALELKDKIKGSTAFLFSDLDAYDLAIELIKNKSPAKAKPGQIATHDLEIPAGPTDLTPGPAISELGALGIQIMIQGGKIEIKSPKVIAKTGEAISQKASDMLAKLNIFPFTIGFLPVCAYDSKENTIYLNIEINTEETLNSLNNSYSKALAFALEIGYTTSETVPLMIQKAANEERKLIRVITGEVEEIISAEPEKQEIKQEVKKEEPKVDFAASFF